MIGRPRVSRRVAFGVAVTIAILAASGAPAGVGAAAGMGAEAARTNALAVGGAGRAGIGRVASGSEGVPCGDLVTPADPAADSSAVALLQHLYYGAGRETLYGQQDDLALNSVNTAESVRAGEARHDGDSGVKEAVGRYPAVFGWDLGQLELKGDNRAFGSAAGEGRPSALPAGAAKFAYDGLTGDGLAWDDLVAWIREAHALGGIITLSWSAVNPITYQPGQPNGYPGSIAAVLPGGAHHLRFKAWLDTIAEFNLELVDDSGQPIPVVFRPYHEHSGSWYWWGLDDSVTGTAAVQPEQFVELWRFTVDYLRAAGVHNFLYAYAPDRSTLGDPMDLLEGGAARVLSDSEFAEFMTSAWEETFWAAWSEGFPGTDYVDVYGLDNYWDTGAGHPFHPYRGDQPKLRQLFTSTLDILARHAAADGKVAALTQTDADAAEMVQGIRLAGADLFGDTYEQAAATAYVLRWRGATDGLEALASDAVTWFAVPDSPDRWTAPVPCSAGALSAEFSSRQVTLGDPALSSDKASLVGSGALPTISVTDTRTGGPGWDVTIASGPYLVGPQEVDAAALGLTPDVVAQASGQVVTAGPAVAAGVGFVGGTPLAWSPPGSSRGQAVMGGVLSYKIPASVIPGTYRAVLTVTVL